MNQKEMFRMSTSGFSLFSPPGKPSVMLVKKFIRWSLLGLLLMQSSAALAFEFTTDFMQGFYWERFPINFAIVESDPVKKAQLIRLVDDAIEEWERYSNIDLWNRVDSSSNVLRWSSNYQAETGYDAQTTLAVTFRHITGPYVRKTEIILNQAHHINSYERHLKTVIIHELGHTLGLDHSYARGAVMEAGVDLFYDGLHEDDIQGLNEVTGQSVSRQESRYVSPLAYDESTTTFGPSCGTVNLPTGGGSGGSGSMLFSLLLGLIFALPKIVRKKDPSIQKA